MANAYVVETEVHNIENPWSEVATDTSITLAEHSINAVIHGGAALLTLGMSIPLSVGGIAVSHSQQIWYEKETKCQAQKIYVLCKQPQQVNVKYFMFVCVQCTDKVNRFLAMTTVTGSDKIVVEGSLVNKDDAVKWLCQKNEHMKTYAQKLNATSKPIGGTDAATWTYAANRIGNKVLLFKSGFELDVKKGVIQFCRNNNSGIYHSGRRFLSNHRKIKHLNNKTGNWVPYVEAAGFRWDKGEETCKLRIRKTDALGLLVLFTKNIKNKTNDEYILSKRFVHEKQTNIVKALSIICNYDELIDM